MKKLNTAIAHTIFGKLGIYAIQIITLMLYARMFSPENFGAVASIVVFIAFFQLLTDIGIGPVIINEKNTKNEELGGIYFITIILGSLTSIFFYLLTGPILDYYHYDFSPIVLYISIPTIFFSCISIVPYTLLIKELKFLTVSYIDAVSHIITLIFIASLFGMEVDPLFLLMSKTSIYSISRFFLLKYYEQNTKLGNYSITRNFSFVKRNYRMAAYQFGFGLINYFARNLDNLLVGKYLGAAKLGLYDQAYQLMRYPLQLISFSLSSAIQPVLSEYKDNKIILEREHVYLVGKLVIIGVLISLVIHFNADTIVYILLGSKWSGVSELIRVLNYSLPIQMVIATSGGFFQALGRFDLLFRAGLIGSIIFVTNIVFAIYLFENLLAVTYAVTISFIVNSISIYFIMYKYGFGISSIKFRLSLLVSLFKCVPLFFPFLIFDVLKVYFELNILTMVINLFLPFFICIPYIYFLVLKRRAT
ncbi:oligosaccharide flippase family protein [Pseudoalteromonas xiamenensis]|uniref:Oligosaccharide flippase family protein n=1 Tax=Pseudoalteromonas xiamenensis TaxID=882626 RepID=A0A975HLX3_9GAMM|nr:oligosaccharide flippase family protein [Pseudoalteromonas xiamenensis]QTH72551.1 oligosaccharide flippase family protein [Pseudoalteromonas xiamenensis]